MTRTPFFLLLTGLLLIANAGFSQAFELVEEYRKRYPDKDLVCLDDRKLASFLIAKDGALQITEDLEETYLYLSESVGVNEESISFDSFSSVQKLEAYTEVPNEKGKYKKMRVSSFTERDEFSDNIFHDDTRSLNFRFPKVVKGAKTFMKYQRVHNIPQTTSRYFFVSGTPMEKAEFTVVADENVNLIWKVFNDQEAQIQFSERSEKGQRILTWSAKDLPPTKMEDGSSSTAAWAPHVVVYVHSYKSNGTETPVLRDVSDLFAWYNGLIGRMQNESTPELKALVDSLTSDVSQEEEKVRTMFRWVQDQIKYVAFEDGLGGLIPREAGDVCRKKFGDCKDMANLLHVMCREAGIPTYLTWVGTRSIPYTYSEMPTPIVDNHMILTYGPIDDLRWLDATSSTAEFGVPTAFIQGKEALLKLNETDFAVVKVPEMDANFNLVEERIRLGIDEKSVKGEAQMILSGVYRSMMADAAGYLQGNPKQKDAFFKDYLSKGNNTFQLQDVELDVPQLHEGSAEVNYDFLLRDYALKIDDEWIVNLNLTAYYADEKLRKDRKLPREFEFRSGIESTVTFDIPEGFEVKYLPGDGHYTNEHFNFHYHYEVIDRQIVYKQSVRVDAMVLEPQQFGDWNEMVDRMRKAYRESIVLKASGEAEPK